MKAKVLFLLLILPNTAFSHEKLNKISISPIQLLGYNRLNLEYERGFNDGRLGCAVYLGKTGYASRKVHGQYSYLSEENVAIKRYGKAIDKSCFWYGGVLSVASGNIYSDNKVDSTTNIGALGIMASSGYQFFIHSFYLNLYIGAGYSLTNNFFGSAHFNDALGKPSNWLLTYGLKAGFKF